MKPKAILLDYSEHLAIYILNRNLLKHFVELLFFCNLHQSVNKVILQFTVFEAIFINISIFIHIHFLHQVYNADFQNTNNCSMQDVLSARIQYPHKR